MKLEIMKLGEGFLCPVCGSDQLGMSRNVGTLGSGYNFTVGCRNCLNFTTATNEQLALTAYAIKWESKKALASL